jgi:hypothetical protein
LSSRHGFACFPRAEKLPPAAGLLVGDGNTSEDLAFSSGCNFSSGMRRGRNVMKTLISTLAVALALAFTGPAFAGDVTKATDKASCDKAGGTWDDTAKKCSEKKM